MTIKKNYLFIPSVPTPNGPLHLGHIGGPYLRADVLARYLRMQGHNALLICGSDSYESYVAKEADQKNKKDEEIANFYHQTISDNLQMMNIDICNFINPLAPKWHGQYLDWHRLVLKKLQENNACNIIDEKLVFDITKNYYLTGADLHGKCPNCSEAVNSYFCEACGEHFKPEDIIDINDPNLVNVNNLFLKLKHTVKHIAINEETIINYERFLAKQERYFRLTTHHRWGIKYHDQQVLFSYGFLYAYFLFLGEVAKTHLQIDYHPFAKQSTVTTVSSFGIDNAIPFLASIHGITDYYHEFKPFDYYLMNHFYHLDGKKFSTSRNHAIWVEEINANNYESDIVRLFLAKINVSDEIGNFSYSQFVAYHDYISHVFNTIAKIRFAASSKTTTINDHLKNHSHQFLSNQQQYLSLVNYAPHKAVIDIEAWLTLLPNYKNNNSDYIYWLKTLSQLIHPLMPNKGKQLWQSLNYSGEPRFPFEDQTKEVVHAH